MGASVTLPASGFSRGGKTLAGWNTAADGTGTPHALGARYTINGSAILYAVWTWANAGTSGDPYLIYDTAGMREIDNDPAADYKLENDISIGGTWESLSNVPTTFTGTFDGNGHTVHFNAATVTGPAAGEPGWGLFGTMTQPGVIENLKVTGSINAERNDGGSHFYLGGIVGWVSQNPAPIIRNCVSAVDVTAIGGYAGGIVGGSQLCTIINSYATGSVSMSTAGQSFYTSHEGAGAGGIIGLSNGASIGYCYAENTVSASASGLPLMPNIVAGGIVGARWGGIVSNSVALNPSLSVSGTGTLTTHRIGGTNTSNYGRDDMSMYQNDIPYTYTSGGYNGTDVAMSAVRTEAWWSALFGSYWGGGLANESQPWKWDPVLQRPVLWFE
jgi:hypothetical protein